VAELAIDAGMTDKELEEYLKRKLKDMRDHIARDRAAGFEPTPFLRGCLHSLYMLALEMQYFPYEVSMDQWLDS
jgi:hypothetical protein